MNSVNSIQLDTNSLNSIWQRGKFFFLRKKPSDPIYQCEHSEALPEETPM